MAISDTVPPKSFQRGGKIVFPYNVTTRQVTDIQTGKTRTQYEYEESEGNTEILAQKVAEARQSLILSGIADMTYAELDDYINVNVTTLASSKVFIKRLAKVTLALVKLVEEANLKGEIK